MEWRSSNLEFSASVWWLLFVVLPCASLEVRLRANFAADVVLLTLLPLHGFVTQRRCASTRPDAAQSACVLSSIQYRVSALTSSDAVGVKMTMTRCVVTSLTRSDSLRRTWEDQRDDLRGQTCERYNKFQARLERKGERKYSHSAMGSLARVDLLGRSFSPTRFFLLTSASPEVWSLSVFLRPTVDRNPFEMSSWYFWPRFRRFDFRTTETK